MSTKLLICIHSRASGRPACADRGSQELALMLEKEIAERHLAVPLERMFCLGRCDQGPNMRIAPGGEFFHHVTAADIPTIMDAIQQCKIPERTHSEEKGETPPIWGENFKWE